jgi:hypothetical protein
MGVFAGTSQPVRLIRDGTSFSTDCSHCGRRATFREVLVRRALRLLGIDLYEYDETGVRCDACETAFTEDDAIELLDRAEPPPPEEQAAIEARRLAHYKAEFEARARARHAEAVRVRAHEDVRRAREAQVDEELAALKRRLGK